MKTCATSIACFAKRIQRNASLETLLAKAPETQEELRELIIRTGLKTLKSLCPDQQIPAYEDLAPPKINAFNMLAPHYLKIIDAPVKTRARIETKMQHLSAQNPEIDAAHTYDVSRLSIVVAQPNIADCFVDKLAESNRNFCDVGWNLYMNGYMQRQLAIECNGMASELLIREPSFCDLSFQIHTEYEKERALPQDSPSYLAVVTEQRQRYLKIIPDLSPQWQVIYAAKVVEANRLLPPNLQVTPLPPIIEEIRKTELYTQYQAEQKLAGGRSA